MYSSKDTLCNETFQYNEVARPIMEDICSPLFTYSGLTTFTYMRFENDRFFHVSSNLPLANYYVGNDFYQKHLERYATEICQIAPGGFGFFLREYDIKGSSLSQDITETLNHFNVAHGLSFYWRGESKVEGFHFGTVKENELIINFYLNHMNMLKRFARFFKNNAFEHLTPIRPHRALSSETSVFSEIKKLESKKKPILPPSMDLWDDFNTHIGNSQHLSKREVECLALLAHGKRVREIARYLLISPRTVESHLNFVKLKLDLTTSQIIDYYWDSNLSWICPIKWKTDNEK